MKRLKELRKKIGISQKDFAVIMHVSQNTISNWENGNREPDNDNIGKLADFFDVSVDYLLGISDIPSYPKTLNAYTPKNQIQIPNYVSIRADRGVLTLDGFQGHEYFNASSVNPSAIKDYFCTQIKGDSMTPELREGDIILVKKQSYVDNGKIALVAIGDREATVKKIKIGKDYIELIPINPAYDSFVVEGERLEELHIIGLVVELKRKFG